MCLNYSMPMVALKPNVAIGIVEVEYAIEGTKLQVLIDDKLRDAFVRERPFNPKLKPFI